MMVMEIKWLSNLLSSLKPIENDGKFPCVSETTKVMSISESELIVTQQKFLLCHYLLTLMGGRVWVGGDIIT
jgi:hypothetical protein